MFGCHTLQLTHFRLHTNTKTEAEILERLVTHLSQAAGLTTCIGNCSVKSLILTFSFISQGNGHLWPLTMNCVLCIMLFCVLLNFKGGT